MDEKEKGKRVTMKIRAEILIELEPLKYLPFVTEENFICVYEKGIIWHDSICSTILQKNPYHMIHVWQTE